MLTGTSVLCLMILDHQSPGKSLVPVHRISLLHVAVAVPVAPLDRGLTLSLSKKALMQPTK
jgi:hypothetical protein